MQPRPIADTSRLLFPSLRFFIASPSNDPIDWPGYDAALEDVFHASEPAERLPKRGKRGRKSSPPHNLRRFSSFVQLKDRVVEIVPRKLVASFFLQNALKSRTFIL